MNARLNAVLVSVAKQRSKSSGLEYDELFNEGWLFASDPVRARTVEGHLQDDFQRPGADMTVGQQRLFRDIDRRLSEYVAEVKGELPRGVQKSTYGQGQQAVQVNPRARRMYWDGTEEWAEPTVDEAFPMDDEGNQAYLVLEVAPEYGEFEPLNGRYGFAQGMPFGIIGHALDLGLISVHQADLLERLMQGDSATDLACRFPEEAKGSIQSSVSQALKALRKEPKLQEWAQSLGFNPLAPKGERWVSEHRHCDGRPAGPAAQRPFLCDCERGQASYDEDALDRSDPFLRVLPSDTERVQPTRAA